MSKLTALIKGSCAHQRLQCDCVQNCRPPDGMVYRASLRLAGNYLSTTSSKWSSSDWNVQLHC